MIPRQESFSQVLPREQNGLWVDVLEDLEKARARAPECSATARAFSQRVERAFRCHLLSAEGGLFEPCPYPNGQGNLENSCQPCYGENLVHR